MKISNMKMIKKKRNFSGFTYEAAFKYLKIERLIPWKFISTPRIPSEFFNQRMFRLEQRFDLQKCEESKKLLIDAICEEALEGFNLLKIWKGASIESDELIGAADYLIAKNRAYLEAPFLCIVEAKKDDFIQGLAQCLVEMRACQWINREVGRNIDVMGVVSNGTGWQVYKMQIDGTVYEGAFRGIANIDEILGDLRYMFELCESYFR
jgi:hypothetical protein